MLLNPLDGVGVAVNELKSAEVAMRQSGMDYDIAIQGHENPFTHKPSDRFKGVFRTDTGEMLGSVEGGYSLMQNRDFFPPLVDKITSETAARIVRAGQWDSGAYAFMTLQWPEEMDINLLGVDRVQRRVMLTINHTGKQSNLFMFVPYRFWCSNGQIVLIPGCDWMFRVFHKATITQRVKDIEETLQRSMVYWDQLPHVLEVLATTKVTDAKAEDIAKKFFDPQNKAKDMKDGKPNEAKERVARFMHLWDDQPGSGKMGNSGIEKTAWWALQAGIHMLDHDRNTRVRKGQKEVPGMAELHRFKAHWPGNQAARDKERLTHALYHDKDLGIHERINLCLN